MSKEKEFDEILGQRKQTNIYAKLLKVKSEIGTLTKKADNPFFKSKYLDLSDLLEAVEPVLEKHGLLLMQPILNGKVISIIFDADHSTQTIDFKNKFHQVQSEMTIPETITDPQKLGSCITYFRRYTLQSLLSLQAVDDDGNTASKASKPLDANRFDSALTAIEDGKYSVEQLKRDWSLTADQEEALNNFING